MYDVAHKGQWAATEPGMEAVEMAILGGIFGAALGGLVGAGVGTVVPGPGNAAGGLFGIGAGALVGALLGVAIANQK